MNIQPLGLIDRLPYQSPLRHHSLSTFGIIGTLLFLAPVIYMVVMIVIPYSQGQFYQSQFEIQGSTNQFFQTPYDFKMAIVLTNINNGTIANHTQLYNFLFPKMFSSYLIGGPQNTQPAILCDPKYFSDAINPIKLTDCFMLNFNKSFTHLFNSQNSLQTSTTGIQIMYKCLNPFSCGSTGTQMLATQANYSYIYGNYSVAIYLSTPVVQADGKIKHQVSYISTGSYYSSNTINANIDAEVVVNNITMDYSIMPWRNIIKYSIIEYLGFVKGYGRTKALMNINAGRYDIISTNYQTLTFRYYKKQDWLLGVIGGFSSLTYLILWCICFSLVQRRRMIYLAEQFLVQMEQDKNIQNNCKVEQLMKSPKISWWYLWFGLQNCQHNSSIDKVKRMLDITQVIKSIKMINRNLAAKNMELQKNQIVLQIQQQQKRSIKRQRSQIQKIQKIQSVQFLPFDPKIEMNNEKYIPIDDTIKPTNENLMILQTSAKKQEKDEKVKQQHNFDYVVLESKRQNDDGQQMKQQQQIDFKGNEQLIRQFKLQKLDKQCLIERGQIKQNKRQQIDKQQNILQPVLIKQQSKILMNQQNIIQMKHPQLSKKQSSLIGIQSSYLNIIIEDKNNINFNLFPTVLHNQGRIDQFNELVQIQKYKDQPPQLPKTKATLIIQQMLKYIRYIDFYGARVSFEMNYVNHSFFGFLCTLFILAILFVQNFNMLQLLDQPQIVHSRDFLSPKNINYTLTTGPSQSFKPFVCFSSSMYFMIQSYVQLTMYTYSVSQGYRNYTPVNLGSNQHSYLGISPSSIYYSIDTSYCYTFPDNVKIAMGGYGTPQEAYFGFNIAGYCTGTVSFCQANKASINSDFYSFINTGSGKITFYIPINQFDPQRRSVYTGQVYAQVLREGSTGFNAVSSIEQTLYVDSIQLLDTFSRVFLGQQPRIIEQTVCTNRYNVGQNTRTVNSSIAYYQLLVRPSENLTKVYLSGYTLVVILAIFGGVIAILYCFFSFFAKGYNYLNIRAKLAEQAYHEQIYNYGFLIKVCYLILPQWMIKLLCCGDTLFKLKRMYQIDNFIRQDLNSIQMIKVLNTCLKLSATNNNPYLQNLSLIYFKQNPIHKVQSIQQYSQFVDNQQQDNNLLGKASEHSNHKINNSHHQQSITDNKQKMKEGQSESDHEIQSQDNEINRIQDLLSDENVQKLLPQDQFHHQPQSRFNQIINSCDIFPAEAQFYLHGQSKVKSIFGAVLSILTITIVCIICFNVVMYYGKSQNYKISYERGMVIDPQTAPPLQLNNNNFALAIGYYGKPGFNFQNVAQYLNTSSNSLLGISLYVYNQTWINNKLVTNFTKYDLLNCPANYFQRFISANMDPSYYSSISNAFCLPPTFNLNLTSNIKNNSQYFKISIYNKTTSTSTLQSLVTSFPLGIFMTIPVIDLSNKKFTYKVQSIRQNSDALTSGTVKSYEANLTLTQQQVTFTSPNYTLNQNGTTIQTYNYVEDRFYEYVNNLLPTSAPTSYNITFSYSGLRQTYKQVYTSAFQIIGYVGGIIVVVVLILRAFGGSFNNYKKLYLVGKQLYTYYPRNRELLRRQMKKKYNNKIQPNILQFAINKQQNQYHQDMNNLNQFQIFLAWLVSFPAIIFSQLLKKGNLYKVYTIQKRAVQDLNLFKVYRQYKQIKRLFNNKIKLNPSMCKYITNIYDKNIVLNNQKLDFTINNQKYNRLIKFHHLSSKDQYKLNLAISYYPDLLPISAIFSRSYIQKTAYLQQDGDIDPSYRQEQITQKRSQKLRNRGIQQNLKRQQQYSDKILMKQQVLEYPAQDNKYEYSKQVEDQSQSNSSNQ